MTAFPQTPRNRVRRIPERARYEKNEIYTILDEALVCHVGIVTEEGPLVLPMLPGRLEDTLYLHGAPASRLLKHISQGGEVCITATLVDGLVLARSIFHHSVNYRSAVLFGKGRPVEKEDEKLRALEVISEHVCPGRWDEARRPSPRELAATAVVAVEIESASAKVRSGPVNDDPADAAWPVWAGVLPLELHAGEPLPSEGVNLPPPPTVTSYRRGKRAG
ncbi:predicted flavin-nucleotide-binding protein [Anaerolinea thermolimosa]|uniref:pyridoxamine 5'-phosphate oxidase family protein n=1 Tax=Anaerolinea thermolimosa TaxID=229919 RepID=UPI0007840CC5|nr:pyridoxamine 5'-phosphate oxidase family protein [Anaerolinea thermolimosa]GAP08137.1 predicted flavin-nucleotide-binding protein [Anaerolinea thermolimosa]